jgi:hypothetical protein
VDNTPSAPPTTWTAAENHPFGDFAITGIAYGAGKFVAVGSEGVIAYSTDGVSWTEASPGVVNFHPTVIFNGIFYGGGKFIAFGVESRQGFLVTSTDGVSWSDVYIPKNDPRAMRSLFNESKITGIAYGAGKFVAVGYNGIIMHSPDGASWGVATTDAFSYTWLDDRIERARSAPIMGIAYGAGKFVAVGFGDGNTDSNDDGRIAVSTDGITWTRVARAVSRFGTGAAISITGIAYGPSSAGGGKFVVGLSDGDMEVSTNGTTWTKVNTGDSGSSSFECIAYGGGWFVVNDPARAYKMVYSADGVSWTAIDIRDPHFVYGPIFARIAYGGGRFVGVGKGIIMYSN